jgi:choline dehydrogenase-like flavoprotein
MADVYASSRVAISGVTVSLSARELHTLDLLQRTFSPLECDYAIATAQVATALTLLPAHKRAQLLGLLRLLETPALAMLLTGRLASFSALDDRIRARLLVAMADSRIEKLRTGFQAFKRLCLSAAYSAVDANGRNALWDVIGYPGSRNDRPSPEPALPLFEPTTNELDADAVVVGSGAGGGVTAALLAKSGRRVVVLEAGPPADPATFTQLEAQSMSRLYLDHALAATEDLGIVLLAGACVGGGTTVNWCTSLPISKKVAAQWAEASGGIDFEHELRPHYEAVSARLQIAPSEQHNPNNAALLRGCKALGWHAAASPKNSVGCSEGCGYCGFGCCYGAKRSMPSTYLSDATQEGAIVVAEATVERVLFQRARACAVEAHYKGRNLCVRAPLVVLAAGSLRTPGILARSGIGASHLGRHLKLHPTTAVFALFDEPIETFKGQMQTVYSDQFGDLEGAYGAKLEVAPAHPGLCAFALPWRSREQHAAAMRQSAFAAAFISLTRDRGEGTVDLDQRSGVHYRLSRYDAKHMLTAVNGLIDVAFAAGAQKVMTLHQQAFELARPDAGEQRRHQFAEQLLSSSTSPNRLAIFSAHQMGTCRIHRDRRYGVVDERCAVHGAEGLYVADGSVFPLASGVNPMLTIMALAHRTSSLIDST